MTPEQLRDWLASPAAELEAREEDLHHPKARLKAMENILMDLIETRKIDSRIALDIVHTYRVMTADHFFADLYHNGRVPQ